MSKRRPVSGKGRKGTSKYPATLQHSPPTRSYLFTSEPVSQGHPDKLADLISDTILDRFLSEDREAKVACETMILDELIVIGGEFHSATTGLVKAIAKEAPGIVRQLLRRVGYDDSFPVINPQECDIQIIFNSQSSVIRQGVDLAGEDICAGAQGLVFGYATDETPEPKPLPITFNYTLEKL
jgi:S-adenosylmethionine synthetase